MKLKQKWIYLAILAVLPLMQACSQSPEQGAEKTAVYSANPATETANVAFSKPNDGAITDQNVTVVMLVNGMQAHKAGALIDGTGHHHLIIDGAFIAQGETVPKDARHQHFGKGQSSTTLHLTPGQHTLTLQFADGHHQSYGKAMSSTITIHVK